MEISNVFDFVGDRFKKEKIDFLLVGGFAVNQHKVSRYTDDVDFMIALNDFERASQLLKEIGYDDIEKHENFARLRSLKKDRITVDFLFVDTETLKELLAQSVPARISKFEFQVPSVKHLIALKLHAIRNNTSGRLLKDLPDICNLIKENRLLIHDDEMKSLFLKYGTAEIYKSAVFFLGQS